LASIDFSRLTPIFNDSLSHAKKLLILVYGLSGKSRYSKLYSSNLLNCFLFSIICETKYEPFLLSYRLSLSNLSLISLVSWKCLLRILRDTKNSLESLWILNSTIRGIRNAIAYFNFSPWGSSLLRILFNFYRHNEQL